MTDTTTTTRTGITFAVDRVAPVTAPLPECRAHEAVRAMVGGDIESCGDYHGTVVRDVRYQPLLAAVYTAFSQHRPLVLTPDAVWITIAQGVAHHMVLHGERLRSRFVSHQGRLELAFVTTEWVEGSPENPWPQAFASWSGQIAGHVGPEVHDRLVCDFGTTGPVERAVSQIVMMDVFERYFHYVDYCICGIPQVTLEGTPADWQRLRDKVAGLSIFDLDWWLRHLLPVCDQFVRASRGDVDLKHWQSICKLREEYGGDVINGWVAKLFPYLRAFYDGPCSRRNPVFETGEGFQTPLAPPGLSRVPFTWRNVLANRDRPMEAIGGLVGVTQDPATLALRPKVGWAVRQAEPMDVLLARLARDHATFPTAIRAHADGDGDNDGNGRRAWSGLPPDLSAFYHRTGGAELFGRGAAAACRIVPRDRIEDLDWGESPDARSGSGPGGRIWHRFAWLADGTWLAINLDRNLHLAPCADDQALWARRDDLGDSFAPVCHGSKGTNGRPGRNPVVALSFSELLERLLDGRGQPYWLDPRLKDYGDAMKYTRTV